MSGLKAMGSSLDQRIRAIMSGERRGALAGATREALSVAAIGYSTAIRLRNYGYNSGLLKSRRLARPVISVGNITTGGTGKTPVVRWLADNLREVKPAVLMRGYKSAENFSDEQSLLEEQLGGVPVIARPDRRRGAAAALAKQHDTGLFILDDGMQHRKMARDFELVLVDATNPFGFGHVLPRGLLREPLAGLARANAFLITRVDLITSEELESIKYRLRVNNSASPIFGAQHSIATFWCGGEQFSAEALRGKRVCLFCGVGNPAGVRKQLELLGINIVEERYFPDHHHYSISDLNTLAEVNTDLMVTTEKDWAKISRLNHPILQRIWRTELALSFSGDDEQKLLEQIRLSISRPSR